MANPQQVRGNKPRVYLEIRNKSGGGIDPTTLKFRYKADGVTEVILVYGVSNLVVREETGKYYVDLPLDTLNSKNKYYYRWEASGTGQAAAEGIIETTSIYEEP